MSKRVVEWRDGVPICTEDRCPQYDGKRCRELGFRPDRMCEPEVRDRLAAPPAPQSSPGGYVSLDLIADQIEATATGLGNLARRIRAAAPTRKGDAGTLPSTAPSAFPQEPEKTR